MNPMAKLPGNRKEHLWSAKFLDPLPPDSEMREGRAQTSGSESPERGSTASGSLPSGSTVRSERRQSFRPATTASASRGKSARERRRRFASTSAD